MKHKPFGKYKRRVERAKLDPKTPENEPMCSVEAFEKWWDQVGQPKFEDRCITQVEGDREYSWEGLIRVIAGQAFIAGQQTAHGVCEDERR